MNQAGAAHQILKGTPLKENITKKIIFFLENPIIKANFDL